MPSGPKIDDNFTAEQAKALYASEWWKSRTHEEIVRFQLFTGMLCMPFDVFHEAVEKALGRPVWTHEFGLNHERLCAEFLGEQPAPTFDEIVNLIPVEKRVLVGI